MAEILSSWMFDVPDGGDVKRPYSIDLSEDELLILYGALQSEGAFPEVTGYKEGDPPKWHPDAESEEAVQHWRATNRLLDRLPPLFTDRDLMRLTYRALDEIERTEAPRRATSWQHSAIRRYLKGTLPSGVDLPEASPEVFAGREGSDG